MIRRITISNYALIRELTICPSSGFNIITGETGAGKSIILGALGLLQGKRADSKSIASDGEKSVVEAEVVTADGSVRTLRREILPSGRSRAMIDGKSVALGELAALAAPLIDIHSQHQNLQLGDPRFQLEVIDKLAGNGELSEKYRQAYADYRVALQNFARTRDEIERTRSDADYLEYQLAEFEGVELNAGEDDELEQLRDRLEYSAEIAKSLSAAANLLSMSDSSACEVLSLAIDNLRNAAELSEAYAPMVERLEAIHSELDSIGEEIGDDAASTPGDTRSLEEIERKLDKINSLKAKHRAATIEQLAAVRDGLAARLNAVQNSEETLRTLEQNARRLKKSALETATEISQRRKAAAESLAAELAERARPLGMENLVVEINVEAGKLNPDGIDTVEFLFAFNKNQKPEPAANRASGGEISRVMLALKSITVEHRFTPTIIFDEIDTGVSGEVANRMGRLMEIIGRHIQVIAITHLPQVAALGEKHFKVFKRDDDTSTRTHITELDSEGKRRELALMLSGKPDDEAALGAADSLINNKNINLTTTI